MTLKNVEVIEQQELHEKTWYQRFNFKTFRKKLVASAITTGVLVVSNAHAAEGDIPDFLAPAKTALAGIGTNLGALFLSVIGILLIIIAFTISKGGIKKAG
ncbi:hypothetical protein [Acinetobacter bereziniae]|uniref:hypothetical protein n=1 Tax=Acinetobacter bereziniae TaxID=106648 RepID=UPI0011161AB3|nr:hypothetical protein [Acinetobacter bereziniae]TNL41160.1 hypothetical protein EYB59_23175 [Acinetobacter bereziniae]TNL45866.1 hypothetical protein EYY58_22875 [Acinetobacter bereziniae]